MAHFHAQALALTAVKATLLQGCLVFNSFVESLEQEEDDDSDDDDMKEAKPDKPAFEKPTPYQFLIKVEHSFFKMVTNTTMLRSLEFVSLRIFDVRTAGKLMKDVTKVIRHYYDK
jgi:hypothetical protein